MTKASQRQENGTGPTAPPPDQEWCDPRPAAIPAPSVWPMVLALALTISLWGILTSWLFVAVGLLLTVFSLYRWIEELRQ